MLVDKIMSLIPLRANPLGDYVGVNINKRETQIIISISSERENFKDLPKTIYSILNQSLKPDRLILWLDSEYEDKLNLPYEITQFVKNGLEIRFVDNMKLYSKTMYALKEFQEAVIVTAVENQYYPKNWLETFYLSYIANPEDILAMHALQVLRQDNILRLEKNSVLGSSYANIFCERYGILYPPKCFSTELFRKDIYLKYSQYSQEAWLWVMALISNRKIRVLKSSKRFTVNNQTVSIIEESLNNLLPFYRNNIFTKLK